MGKISVRFVDVVLSRDTFLKDKVAVPCEKAIDLMLDWIVDEIE